MSTLEELRRNIEIASDLGSVVTMMKTLAAVSIRQYEKAVEALADYHQTIAWGFQIALRHASHARIEREMSKHTGAILFGTDQGMCGPLNEGIVSHLRMQQSQERSERPWLLMAVGIRMEGLLQEMDLPVARTYRVPTSATDIPSLVQDLLISIDRWREDAGVSRILLFHHRRTSAAGFQPHLVQVLPLHPSLFQQWRTIPWTSRSLPQIATPPEILLSRLVHHHLFVSLFRACAEALASENASRIAAMQAAENNIEEHLEELRFAYNQLRQTAITEELLDLINGFESLRPP